MRLVGRGLLVVVIALLAAGAAYAFSESQERVYESITQFAYGGLLSPERRILGANFGEPAVDEDIGIATQAAQVNSFDISRRTARAAPGLGYSASEIDARVNAQPARGSLVVVLTARGRSREEADRLGSAYAKAYLGFLRGREKARAGEIEQVLQRRLDRLPDLAKEGLVGATVREQLSTVRVLKQVGSGSAQVIEGARSSEAPTEPQTTRNVLFGLLFGLAAGIGLVALRKETIARGTAAARRRAARLATGDAGPEPQR